MITEGQVMDIAREALFLIIKVSAPLLLISLVIGLIVSIFQTITSIQEQTLTFVPKILLVFIGMMLLGGWMLENLTSFITDLWSDFGVYLRQVDSMVNYGFSLYTFEYFLMILVRVASFVSVAPFFGMNTVPNRVKVGLSVFLALILYQVIVPKEVLEYSGVIEFAIIVLREGITGLLIGFAANICNSIIVFSGKVIDMEIGLAMANMYDPTTNTQSGLTGTMYNYFIMLLLIITDMHHYILRALIDTYQLIPVNGTAFNWEHLMGTMMMFITDLMVLGFRIVLPIFATSMILNCILGIMAKVAPQMNMFAVGMQLKILIGFSIIFLTIVLLPDIANIIFREMRKMIVSVIEGMY